MDRSDRITLFGDDHVTCEGSRSTAMYAADDGRRITLTVPWSLRSGIIPPPTIKMWDGNTREDVVFWYDGSARE